MIAIILRVEYNKIEKNITQKQKNYGKIMLNPRKIKNNKKMCSIMSEAERLITLG